MTKQLAIPFGAPVPPTTAKAAAEELDAKYRKFGEDWMTGYLKVKRYPKAAADPNPRAPRPFVGRFVELTSPRRCSVCGNPITDGRAVIYQDMVAHVGCGRTKS